MGLVEFYLLPIQGPWIMQLYEREEDLSPELNAEFVGDDFSYAYDPILQNMFKTTELAYNSNNSALFNFREGDSLDEPVHPDARPSPLREPNRLTDSQKKERLELFKKKPFARLYSEVIRYFLWLNRDGFDA